VEVTAIQVVIDHFVKSFCQVITTPVRGERRIFGLEEVFLTYQLEGSVRVNLGCHGYGKLVFKSGEEALETAATSKDGSRRENYPMPIQRGSDEK
jgi:hypothetical protein